MWRNHVTISLNLYTILTSLVSCIHCNLTNYWLRALIKVMKEHWKKIDIILICSTFTIVSFLLIFLDQKSACLHSLPYYSQAVKHDSVPDDQRCTISASYVIMKISSENFRLSFEYTHLSLCLTFVNNLCAT